MGSRMTVQKMLSKNKEPSNALTITGELPTKSRRGLVYMHATMVTNARVVTILDFRFVAIAAGVVTIPAVVAELVVRFLTTQIHI